MRFEKERRGRREKRNRWRKGEWGKGRSGRRLERAVRERVTIAGFSDGKRERGRKQGGPARCGKTRIALSLMRELSPNWPGLDGERLGKWYGWFSQFCAVSFLSEALEYIHNDNINRVQILIFASSCKAHSIQSERWASVRNEETVSGVLNTTPYANSMCGAVHAPSEKIPIFIIKDHSLDSALSLAGHQRGRASFISLSALLF